MAAPIDIQSLCSLRSPSSESSSPSSWRHSIDGLARLASAISGIGPQTPVAEVRSLVVDACRDVLGTDQVALYTIDPCVGGIDCTATASVPGPARAAFIDLFGDRVADIGLRHPWLYEVAHTQNAYSAFSEAGIGLVLASPVRSEYGFTGTLVAFYPPSTRVDEARLEVLRIVTAQIKSALSYALAIEQSTQLLDGLAGENRVLSQQATIDGLTGLANHRTLQQHLADLCRPSSAKGRRVFSLVMVDVDHFKIYNDTYGHQEGDAALRHVAEVISQGLRQNDLAARYGGEEFALVLRGISKSDAEVVADRLRRSVADQPCAGGPLTVSMGIAEFPADGSTPGEVIEQADKALYHAKITGRNRVVVWGSAGCSLTNTEETARGVPRATVSVLVVEPDRPSAPNDVMLRELLSAENYRIESCSSATDAVKLLRTRAFDVALVASEVLPAQDWRDLGKMAAIHPDMPIVFVTHDLEIGKSRELLRGGASDILLRPYNPAELPVVIERNLERRRLESQRLAQKSTGLMLQAIDALVAAIDAKDPYTAGHSRRVTALCLAISDNLDMSNDERYVLELAARLHDIGKLSLPDTALNKQTPLTEEEWNAMREHPILGSRIVGTIDDLSYVSTVIRHHHERLDGTGYPDGLSGAAIPYLSQILAVADGYEAMTSERAHRGRLSPRQAIDELRNREGAHYNPDIITVLERHLIATEEIVGEDETPGQAA